MYDSQVNCSRCKGGECLEGDLLLTLTAAHEFKGVPERWIGDEEGVG